MSTIKELFSTNTLRVRWLIALLLVVLLAWAGISVARGANRALADQGSIDFHTLWYYALAGRHGTDPYEAYLEGDAFQLTVTHLDGGITDPDTLPFPMNSWQTAPGNTPVMLWMIMPLTYVSFPVAKTLWLGMNLLLMVLVPWLTITYMAHEMTHDAALPLWACAALVLMFVGLFATRNALQVGQTTLIVIAAMIGALLLLEKKRWLWAGVVLGVALSKYTLALPVAVFFLLRWEWRALFVAGVTQGIAWLLMAMLSGVSLFESLQAYIATVDTMAGQEGIHLAGVIGPPWSLLAIILVTGVLIGGLWRAWRSHGLTGRWQRSAVAALAMWSLLIVYHRYYDMALVMLPLTWFAVVLLDGTRQAFRRSDTWVLLGVMISAAGIMMVPAYEIGRLFLADSQMDGWINLFTGLQTVTIVVLMGVSLLLAGRHDTSADS